MSRFGRVVSLIKHGTRLYNIIMAW